MFQATIRSLMCSSKTKQTFKAMQYSKRTYYTDRKAAAVKGIDERTFKFQNNVKNVQKRDKKVNP